MNILVVFSHPNSNSFGKSIVDTIVKSAEAKGDNVKVRDLYSIKFDPVLKLSDFKALNNGNTPADIKEEQKHIKWSDLIIFVYPVWWTGLPSMLKGYVDKVFSSGFAYKYVDGNPVGLLKEKKGLLICTTGTPNHIYEENGMHNSMKQTTDVGIFNFCGIQVIDHMFFGAVPYVSDETRKNYLKEVEKVISEIK